MGEGRAERGTARRRLLTATALLTYSNGIEATGVDAIARAAGVTKRTLYQHFRSKDELVAAALAMRDEPAIAALRSSVERRVARGVRPVDGLFRALGRLFESEDYRGCAFLNAGLEMAAPDHPVHAVTRSHTDARGAFVADLCRAEGVDDPAIHDAVRLVVEGAFVLSATHRDASVAERARVGTRRLLDA